MPASPDAPLMEAFSSCCLISCVTARLGSDKAEESSLLLQTSAFRKSHDRGIKLTHSNLCFLKNQKQRNQACSLKPLLFRISRDRGIKLAPPNLCFPKNSKQRNLARLLKPLPPPRWTTKIEERRSQQTPIFITSL